MAAQCRQTCRMHANWWRIALEHELRERALETPGRASLSEADLALMEDRNRRIAQLGIAVSHFGENCDRPTCARFFGTLWRGSFHELATRPPSDFSNLDSCGTT